MKTLKKLFLLFAVISLLFSCSKDERHEFDMSGWSGNDHKDYHFMQERVYIVNPSGSDDTEALNLAFEEATVFGPNSVVQLEEGKYHLNFIEVREFKGKFRGAGKGKTIIYPVSNLNVDALISQNLNTILIRFVGGDVCMSDMTLLTPPGAFSTGKLDGLVGFSAITSQYISEKEYVKAMINSVEFAGHWENINHGLKAESGFLNTIPGGIPLSNIDITVTNCSFDGFLWYGALIQQIKKGKIVIGTQKDGNTFSNNKTYASLGLWHNINVDVFIVGNTFFNPAGTRFGIEMYSSPYPDYLEQVAQTKVTVCKIEQNVFNITGGTGGMFINDRRRYFYPEDMPMNVQVKDNLFNMSNNATTGIGCFNMMGMMIMHNSFTGTGQYGVRIMGPSPYPYNENGMMIGNYFSNTAFTAATVLLDVRTRNWKIIGGDLEGNVTDYGENNTIINMKIHQPEKHFGELDFDNFEDRR
jgi:hypothetical protein